MLYYKMSRPIRGINKVIEAGGGESRELQDYGWVYGRGFQDINGHPWEIFYMKNGT
jgi:predicted lactoylglutathione lyase